MSYRLTLGNRNVTVAWKREVDQSNTHNSLSMRINNLNLYVRNGWTEINEIWYWRYAIDDYCKCMFLTFLHLVIPPWRMLKYARWYNKTDASSHNPLWTRIHNAITV
jgi:hypothetical protein